MTLMHPLAAKVVRAPSFAGAHCRNRVAEWGCAAMLLGDGMLFTYWPHSLAESAFAPILGLLTAGGIALIYIMTGTSRIVALWFNGGWPVWGPWVRCVGAILGAAVWASMSFALLLQVIQIGRGPSPGIPIYAVLVFVELYSAYRAAADVRIRI